MGRSIDTCYLDKHVIVRTQSAGVWFGTVAAKDGREVILTHARRLWYWKARKSISLSAVALYGIDSSTSKIPPPVESVWMEAIELIEPHGVAMLTILEAPEAQAE